ncbi:MAG: Molybdopterin molybdenumtransferase [Bacteroidia bacterium]|nr:Molybdopterin molybdenumtransferase [Bacteroidia bacterium]
MISVEQAKDLIVENVKPLNSLLLPLSEAFGSVLSENVISPVDLPLFNQSAMDGYTFRFSDYTKKIRINIVGEVAAGDTLTKKLKSGEALRVFTGAMVPEGADTVVMQEKIKVLDDVLCIEDEQLKQGSNVRKKGEQIKKRKIALTKGSALTAGAIGYLAAMGITSVKVISKPKVAVITTGSELIEPGNKLKVGQIFESNSFALEAALHSVHITAVKSFSASDNEQKIYNTLKRCIHNYDLVLITGGISVGDYDFVGKTLKKLGVKNIFYKIKQKPGKPLFFGKSGKTIVFALPGNPAAVLSCFYEYVFPAIQIMQGRKDPFLKRVQLPITKDYAKKKGLSFFLKGKISGETVIPLEGQESFVLSSFAIADCLIYLPEEFENIKAGELVEVHLLPSM